MKFFRFFFCLLLFLPLLFCDLDPSVMETDFITYTPLSIGDFTQLVFLADSSTITFGIVGRTQRADGRPVFIGEWQDGTFQPDTFFYFLNDGFFIATELDTIEDDWLIRLLNPFREQRLAKAQPHPGDAFVHTIGETDSSYWIARAEKKLNTFSGEFKNVFAFELYSKFNSDYFIKTYYGLGVGWIGTAGDKDTGMFASCSYKKMGEKTYGELWPAKNPTFPALAKIREEKFDHRTFSGAFLLGQILAKGPSF